MHIEFDPAKNSANIKKHGIALGEGASALLDPLALVKEDRDSEGEQRLVALGMSNQGRLLVVVYTVRGEVVRVISARRATKTEGKYYA